MNIEGAFPVRAMKAHVALNVKNVDASIAFYRALFGIEPCRVRSDYAKFDVENPPLNLSLNQHQPGMAGALSHLGIQVSSTEEVIAVRDAWAASGLAPRDEMEVVCCYAAQDKAWVADPDGNEWEVFVVRGEFAERGEACCTPAAAIQRETLPRLEMVEAAGKDAACCVPGSGCC